MKLTVWGAAQQVTGSMHLLEIDHYKILIDCGLDYEKDTYQEDNEAFPFDPGLIDVVILTHAHIDHSGNLPTLIRMGFQGQILCTAPTAELSHLLLLDSVNLFLAKQKKKPGRKRGYNGPKPLYLHKHVMDTVDRFVPIKFNMPFQITSQINVTFIPIGHLLGAAAVVINVNLPEGNKSIGFTGDVGRKNYPILTDPEPLPPVDYLVSESTYGGRFHTKDISLTDTLVQHIMETCIKNPGRLIIPAFSIGRTQALVFALNQLFEKGLVPRIPVFVDSPLAVHATAVYRKFHHLMNDEAKSFYQQSGDEFDFDNLTYVKDQKESASISNYYEPCIIISSAGMLEGGRIQDHLYYNIQNYYCTILFIGYCAKGTLGDRLLRGDPIVRMRNRDLMVYATIKKTDLLSGHGDHDDLMSIINHQDPDKLKKVILVHGDPKCMQALSNAIAAKGIDVQSPSRGEVILC